jgi:hypothetical protein
MAYVWYLSQSATVWWFRCTAKLSHDNMIGAFAHQESGRYPSRRHLRLLPYQPQRSVLPPNRPRQPALPLLPLLPPLVPALLDA